MMMIFFFFRMYIFFLVAGSWAYVVIQLGFSVWSVVAMDAQKFMDQYFYGAPTSHLPEAFLRISMAAVWTTYCMCTLTAEIFLKVRYSYGRWFHNSVGIIHEPCNCRPFTCRCAFCLGDAREPTMRLWLTWKNAIPSQERTFITSIQCIPDFQTWLSTLTRISLWKYSSGLRPYC